MGSLATFSCQIYVVTSVEGQRKQYGSFGVFPVCINGLQVVLERVYFTKITVFSTFYALQGDLCPGKVNGGSPCRIVSSGKSVFMHTRMPAGPGRSNRTLVMVTIDGFHGDKELPW